MHFHEDLEQDRKAQDPRLCKAVLEISLNAKEKETGVRTGGEKIKLSLLAAGKIMDLETQQGQQINYENRGEFSVVAGRITTCLIGGLSLLQR